MRLISSLFWILAFLVATYSWMVAFEHGFAWEGFREGFTTEWQEIRDLVLAKQS